MYTNRCIFCFCSKDSALKDVDNESESSSCEEETDEELEMEKYKQQAVFEKEQV